MKKFLGTIVALGCCACLLGQQTADELYTEALSQFDKEAFQLSLELTEEAFAMEKKPKFMLHHGKCHLHLQNYSLALEDFDRAIKKKCGDDEVFYYRAVARIKNFEIDAAKEDLTHFLSKKPDHSDAHYFFGVVNYLNKDTKTATADLEKSIALDEKNMQAWYLLGATHAENGRLSKAANCYEKALELDPEFLRTKLNLAIIKLDQNLLDEALDLINDLRLSGVDFMDEVYYYRAEVKLAQKDSFGACEDLTEAANINPKEYKKIKQDVCLNGRFTRADKRRRTYAAF